MKFTRHKKKILKRNIQVDLFKHNFCYISDYIDKGFLTLLPDVNKFIKFVKELEFSYQLNYIIGQEITDIYIYAFQNRKK